MGTVWRLTIDLKIPSNPSYDFFRYEATDNILKRFGLLSYIYNTINIGLPMAGFKKEDADKEGFYCEFNVNPKLEITEVTRLCCDVDFDGGYGLGEVIFDIFKEACERWMKDGSKIVVSSWEDAGGELSYVKGEADNG